MDLGLADKTVILSGGSKGLGRAIAHEFAQEGAQVFVIARGRDALEATVESIRAAGGTAIGHRADMFDAAQIDDAVRACIKAFAAPDIMVSNLDVPDALPNSAFDIRFDDTTDQDFVRTHEQMVMSVIHFIRAVVPGMKAKRWGRLLTVGSYAMKEPHAPPLQLLLSNTERGAVVGLFKTLSFELGPYNITANIIGTGAFDTDLATGYFKLYGVTKTEYEEQLRASPCGVPRLGRPEELAALAVFLSSEPAAFVNGELVTITGGAYQGTF